jgi:hypothetical protein
MNKRRQAKSLLNRHIYFNVVFKFNRRFGIEKILDRKHDDCSNVLQKLETTSTFIKRSSLKIENVLKSCSEA